jgi:hypothetical protein
VTISLRPFHLDTPQRNAFLAAMAGEVVRRLEGRRAAKVEVACDPRRLNALFEMLRLQQ